MVIKAAEFEKQFLAPLQEEFHTNTQNRILKDGKSICETLYKQLEGFVIFMGKFQKQIPIEIGEIQISLLHSSIYLHKPQIAISAYDEKGILGNEILNIKYDVSWLFCEWEEFRKSIEEKIAEIHGQNFIRKEAVRQMMWNSMNYLTQCLYTTAKYLLAKFDEIEGYDELILTEGFRLSIGSYRDWSRTLFLKRETVDIFFREKDVSLKYCIFREAVYNRKSFEQLDLSHARFIDCEFVHCHFKNVSLKDVILQNCRIYYCTFENVDFYGMTLQGVTMKKNTFQQTRWNFVPDPEHLEDIPDFYKDVDFVDCTLEYLTFVSSDIRRINLMECMTKEIEVQDCKEDEGVFSRKG